jgi:hypothetical protein
LDGHGLLSMWIWPSGDYIPCCHLRTDSCTVNILPDGIAYTFWLVHPLAAMLQWYEQAGAQAPFPCLSVIDFKTVKVDVWYCSKAFL